MNGRLRAVVARRDHLVSRAAEERAAVATLGAALVAPEGGLGRALSAGAVLRTHGWWLLAAAAGLLALRPRRIARIATRVLVLWRGWLAIRTWLQSPRRP